MRLRLSIFISLVFSFFVGNFSYANSDANNKVILKIAHFLPALSTMQKQVLVPWCNDLNQKSNHRIECQFYPSDQLGGSAAQLIDQVRTGIADIVWTAPSYTPGRFKLMETLELPFLLPDAQVGNPVAWAFFNKYAKDTEFKEFKVLSVQTDGGVTFHSNKPLNTVADLPGQKLRAPSPMAAKIMGALHGYGISIQPSQVAESISKGVVDGSLGSWEVVTPTKLDEVTKNHVFPVPGQPYPTATMLMLIMNQKKYDSLPDDLKKLIDDESGSALIKRISAAWKVAEDEARQKVREQGGTIVEYTDRETKEMQKLTDKVTQEWMAKKEIKGFNTQELYAFIQHAVQEYTK